MSIEETLKQEYNDRDANGKMLRLSNRVCNSEEKLRRETQKRTYWRTTRTI